MTEKIYRLIDGLSSRTAASKTVWSATAYDSIYQTSVADYTIQISCRYHGYSESPDYFISILNGVGDVMEEIGDEGLNAEKGQYARDGVNYYLVLKAVYEMARRQALGVEQAIDSILSEFGS